MILDLGTPWMTMMGINPRYRRLKYIAWRRFHGRRAGSIECPR